MNIYDKIKQAIVDNMTPTVIVDNVVDEGNNWKIETENTYWMHTQFPITVDGEERRVIEFVQNEYIVVGGTQPTSANFQLSAPHFDYGFHRKVNAERGKDTNKIPITPFIYMLNVKNEGGSHEYTQYSFEGRPRILFLGSFNKNRDTRDIQQREVIDPMNAMAKIFLQMIEDREDLFQDIDNIKEYDWPDFGDEKIWGHEKKIFDQDLAGTERQFDLKAWQKCDDDIDFEICPDVITSLNGVPTSVDTAAGQNIDIEVLDQDDVQQGTLETNTPNKKLIRINTGGQPVSTNFNTVDTGVDTPGGSTLDINVVNQGDVALGTLTTNTPTEKKIVINTDDEIPVHYIRPALIDLVSSGISNDQKALFDAGTFDYTIPLGTKAQELDPNDPDKLRFNNVWGHKFSFPVTIRAPT